MTVESVCLQLVHYDVANRFLNLVVRLHIVLHLLLYKSAILRHGGVLVTAVSAILCLPRVYLPVPVLLTASSVMVQLLRLRW